MRIAIITLPLHGNYGGILQNYALQTVLKRMGHTVETIALPWEMNLPLWKLPLSYSKRFILKYILRRGWNYKINVEKWYNRTEPDLLKYIQTFINQHITIRQVRSFKDILEIDYEALVVGSDQVWRPKYFKEPIELAYFSFAKDWKKVKRIAYATSFGVDYWEYSPEQTQKCRELVSLFDGISVREDSALELCSSYLGTSAIHILDPVLLLDVKDYRCLFEAKSLVKSKGDLLTYILDEKPVKDYIVDTIAKRYHYKSFRANSRYENMLAPLEERIQPSVEQWLKDFYEAKFVVTDSFHATVFSILFGKPFVVIGNQKRGLSRIQSLLKMFRLEKHLIFDVEGLNPNIDYTFDTDDIKQTLSRLRETAKNYLLSMFDNTSK